MFGLFQILVFIVIGIIDYVLFTQEQLEVKIKELSIWVNKTYKNSKNLIVIGLLKGSFPFFAQLIKSIDIDIIIDFMTVSSYGGGTSNDGSVKIILDLANDIVDKDVLVVEDIIDTGKTMQKVSNLLKSRNPKSFRVLTLLNKPSNRKVSFEPDKFGFEIKKDQFVVGFGFDWEEKLRQLPYIGVIKKEIIAK